MVSREDSFQVEEESKLFSYLQIFKKIQISDIRLVQFQVFGPLFWKGAINNMIRFSSYHQLIHLFSPKNGNSKEVKE